VNKTLSEIAKLVNGRLIGNGRARIRGINGIKEAQEGELSFLANSKYAALAKQSKASAILVSAEVKLPGKNLIVVDNPSIAFAQVINEVLDIKKYAREGIHPTAVIADDAKLGKNVAIGAYAVIEAGASIGEDTVIDPGAYIGHETRLGSFCRIYPHVTIRERCVLGDRVIVHSGTVIGADGFGFEETEGIHAKIPQVGTVEIGNDVEIGANAAIDRARFGKTIIGEGTKIDNLVQIAHNVKIGKNCIIVAQVGIAGSVEVQDKAILAGQAGVAGHLTIGEGAIVGAQSGVTKSVPAHTTVSGYPALPHLEARKLHANLKRLPLYIKSVQDLEKNSVKRKSKKRS